MENHKFLKLALTSLVRNFIFIKKLLKIIKFFMPYLITIVDVLRLSYFFKKYVKFYIKMENFNAAILSNPTEHNESVPIENENNFDSDDFNNTSNVKICDIDTVRSERRIKKRRMASNIYGHF